jgi:hypothetical protein
VVGVGASAGAGVLVVDAYTTVGVVSHAVGTADVGGGGNAVAVVGCGRHCRGRHGCHSDRGRRQRATNGGAAGTEGNGTTCGDGADNGCGVGGDGAGCQRWGSCLNLASLSSSRALLASTS